MVSVLNGFDFVMLNVKLEKMNKFVFGVAYTLLGGIVTAAMLLSWQKSQYTRACGYVIFGEGMEIEKIDAEVLLKGVNRESSFLIKNLEGDIREGLAIATDDFGLRANDCSTEED